MAAAAARGVDVCFRLTERMQVSDLERDRALLDAIECERRDRFVFDADRRDYAAAHALLRRMLCDRYGTDPRAWRFDAAPSGKPQIAGGFPDHRIDFSLSHTRGAVACAIADAAAIGVDVERIDRPGDVDDLARRFFSPAEARAVAAEASPRRRVRFIEFWTLKEAYVKALGAGLSHPLASFSFEFEPGTALRFDDHSGPAHAWRFALYAVGDDRTYRLAVAVRPHAMKADPPIEVRDADVSGAAVRLIRATPMQRGLGPG